MLVFNTLQGVSSKKQVKLFVTKHLAKKCPKRLLHAGLYAVRLTGITGSLKTANRCFGQKTVKTPCETAHNKKPHL
jgi:hypothetical protein